MDLLTLLAVAEDSPQGLVENAPPYVAAGWLLSFGVVAGYAAYVLRRGRDLSRKVPGGQRRWS